jgi:peroxiredoxin
MMPKITGGEALTIVLALVMIGVAGAMINQTAVTSREAAIPDEDAPVSAPFTVGPADSAKLAPDFQLQTSTGQTVRLSDAVKNGPVVLDFWATWCAPCRTELPEINAIANRYRDKGVQVFGINGSATGPQINYFFSKSGPWFPMLVDTGKIVSNEYGIDGIPVTIVIDRNRKIRAGNVAYDPNTPHDLAACLNKILEE